MKKIKINFPLPNDVNLTHYNIFKKIIFIILMMMLLIQIVILIQN